MTDHQIKKMVYKKLSSNYDTIKNKKRSISTHVGSRWYRAPEISILEKQYDQASDIWSVGCCIYEVMVVVQNRHNPDKIQDQVFLKGDSCFPLSPCSEQRNNMKDSASQAEQSVHFVSEFDQLKKTLQKTGQTSEEDLCFVTS